jgi:hypothetical protein
MILNIITHSHPTPPSPQFRSILAQDKSFDGSAGGACPEKQRMIHHWQEKGVNFPFTWKNFPGPLVLKYPHLFTFMLS